jgi:hypothetical protein
VRVQLLEVYNEQVSTSMRFAGVHAAWHGCHAPILVPTTASVSSGGETSPSLVQLRDLLVDNPRRLDIRSTAASGLNVPDATQVSLVYCDGASHSFYVACHWRCLP